MDEKTLEKRIEQIYDAAVIEGNWATLLEDIRQDIEAGSGAVFAWNPGDKTPFLMQLNNLDNSLGENVAAYYHQVDPWLNSALQMANVPDVATDQFFTDRKTYLESEMYQDLSRHYGIGQGLFAFTDNSSDALSTMAFYKENEKEDFGGKELAFFRALQPHLKRGFRLYNQSSKIRQFRNHYENAFFHHPSPALLLNKEKKVIEINILARRILEKNKLLSISNRRLSAKNSRHQRAIDQIISNALKRQFQTTSEKPHYTTLIGYETNSPLRLTACPIGLKNPYSYIFKMNETPVSVMLILSSVGPGDLDEKMLREAFQLTDAEIQVILLLFKGLRPAEIASQRATRLNTVRVQIRNIYDKMDCKSQTRLFAKLKNFVLPVI